MSNQGKYFYEFGSFRLDPVKRRLLRDGEPVALAPKVFDTLLLLVQHSGRTLERDDLMQQVWPDVVVEENNLTQNISALRKVLGDRREESHYIATIPGLGYRFVAEVSRVPPGEAELLVMEPRKLRLVVGGTAEEDEDEKPAAAEIAGRFAATAEPAQAFEPSGPLSPPAPPAGESIIAVVRQHRNVAALLVGLIIVGAAGSALWVYKLVGPDRAGTAATETAANRVEVTVLTRTGTAGLGAISPDGKHLIYSERKAGLESLWLRQIAAPSAQQIVPPAAVLYQGATFSLDGNHVYLVRREMNGAASALYRVPALGGVPIKLLADVHSPITLSPDGGRLAFVRESRDESALMIANADGSDPRKLAARPITDYFKIPAWSPDGQVIACSAGSGDPYDIHNSIVAVQVEDGTQKPLGPQKWAWTRWVEWLADGSGLLITARDSHEAQNQIWHISYPGGAVRRLTSDSKPYYSIRLTADSRTLLAVQSQLLSDIWVVPHRKTDQARKVTFGTGSYGTVCYAPDGRIVYSSSASGDSDIWMMDADGSNQKQLTSNAGVNDDAVVSPDGRYIVFTSNRGGAFNIWRMDSDGGNPVQLTRGSGEKFPQCSPDGKWVVYNTVATDQDFYALWKMPIDGGQPVRLTDSNTYYPAISPEGGHIAYSYRDESSNGRYRVAVMPFAGGPPEKFLGIAQDMDFFPYIHWFPDGKALTFTAARNGVSNVWMQPLGGGEARQLTDFKDEGRILFNWSRDGRQLVFARRHWINDLVLMRHIVPGKI